MRSPNIHRLRKRLSPQEASEWEYKLLGMQRRGLLKECQRPGAQQRRLNVPIHCALKHYVLAPTFRYCPGCTTYRHGLSHYNSVEKRRAKEKIIADFEKSNLAMLTRDRKSLLDQNEKLTRDGLEMSSVIQKLRQEKIENAVSVQRWNGALQREKIKSSRLNQEVSQKQEKIATLNSQLLQAQKIHRDHLAAQQVQQAADLAARQAQQAADLAARQVQQAIPPHQDHGMVMPNNNYHQEAYYYFPEGDAQYHQGNPHGNSPYQQHF